MADHFIVMTHVLVNVTTHMPGLDGAYRTEIRYCPRCGTVFREDYDVKQLRQDAKELFMIVGTEGWVDKEFPQAKLLSRDCRSIPSDCDLNLRSETFIDKYMKESKKKAKEAAMAAGLKP